MNPARSPARRGGSGAAGSMAGTLLGLCLVGGGCLSRRGAAGPSQGGASSAAIPWPAPNATLRAPAASFARDFGLRRVFLDAGHGAPDNRGNASVFCVDEQDFTLGAARELARRLEATGHFVAQLSRDGASLPRYEARVEAAAAWRAEAFVSLHSDVRGASENWEPRPGLSCRRSVAAPGYSVLWSDEGEAPLVAARHALALATARRMREAGFVPYPGADYANSYEADASEPGVFLDRHAEGQRIFVLRRTVMPAILVETHHALDPREAERWTEARTHDAFAAAVSAALAELLAGTPAP